MPYVRKHGHQVAIVHGERDPETRKVVQRVLFTLYSRPEAEAALGRRETNPPLSFRGLVAGHNEALRFDWEKIEARIADLMGELPEHYEYPESGVAPELRRGILVFTQGLLAADPQRLSSAARAVRAQRHELRFLRDLIDWRLRLCDDERESRFTTDNEYGWRGRFLGHGLPAEGMEMLDGLQRKGDDDGAVAVATLFLEIWPDYADGHNLIGDVALEREEFDAALSAYADALRVGRTLFPKRIRKDHWWSDIDTRPYMRAMRNTTVALIRAGRSEEALAWCDRMTKETYDTEASDVFRAAACLNLRRWAEARELAGRYVRIWPEQDFVAAFASFELGDRGDAFARWLHAAIQMPRAARMLVGMRRASDPRGYDEVRDHNAGVNLTRDLATYLGRKKARQWFAAVTCAPEVVSVMSAYAEARNAWEAERGTDQRNGYDRMTEMQTVEFARTMAAELASVRERLG